jgi:hypothetical protein
LPEQFRERHGINGSSAHAINASSRRKGYQHYF